MKLHFIFLIIASLARGFSIGQNNIVYYQQDGIGNVVGLTNNSSDVVEKYSYDVFGFPTVKDGTGNIITSGTYGNRFLFTGRESIREIELYEYRNRFYSSNTGRFLQTDPLRIDAGDHNLYRYVKNDPTNSTDPTGEAGKFFGRNRWEWQQALIGNDEYHPKDALLLWYYGLRNNIRNQQKLREYSMERRRVIIETLQQMLNGNLNRYNLTQLIGAILAHKVHCISEYELDLLPEPLKDLVMEMFNIGSTGQLVPLCPPLQFTVDPLAFGATGGGESFAARCPGVVGD